LPGPPFVCQIGKALCQIGKVPCPQNEGRDCRTLSGPEPSAKLERPRTQDQAPPTMSDHTKSEDQRTKRQALGSLHVDHTMSDHTRSLCTECASAGCASAQCASTHCVCTVSDRASCSALGTHPPGRPRTEAGTPVRWAPSPNPREPLQHILLSAMEITT
jgi:hypothetical protein